MTHTAPPRRTGYGFYAAASIVVANMIGTGVFTSLGFQLVDLQSTFPLLMLWVLGGIAAFCGAITYAELGAAMPRSGGEYTFLGRIYHPGAGFVSGWISATIGFAAPTALAAITFGAYLSAVFPGLPETALAVVLVVALSGIHSTTHRNSGALQSSFTSVKVVLILAFCAAALFMTPDPQPVALVPASGDAGLVFGGGFAVSLIYVSYAYTGWNAVTYLTSELDDVPRQLPWILGGGTALVLVLYVGLNYAFLRAAPMSEMVGQVEVGYIAATHIFGPLGADIMGVALALLLVSTVSAMVVAGPRVLHVIGEDYRPFRWLSKTNEDGIPTTAIFTQAAIAIVFIVTASFESILVFSGFVLGLNSLLTVAGVFVLRIKEPDLPRPYRTWAYPITPIVYLSLTVWTLTYLALDRPSEAGVAFALIAAGTVVYLWTRLAVRGAE
ncbi:MAG: amino acid permease [Gemmatimonadetes bacterium]|jgi:APA family basic amino acid/polyamine antiporter|nr:amino acid permease [Gemmatimonadota bacterium]HAC07387.1 amino acid permease [Gemmatimonadota bacterium]HBE00433.1 amino acid permease [Gemmatimonadota bacterium]HIC55531.1 amino acid permease [Gemmatimonadota bacterium]HIN52603.1 amino acid permease [Gemmatimonadota bacterium]|tara:strand:+ start:813 stop:2135 length:1323 start_codon:yes stop_codon:yes gene_type:complete